jgi:hypothetical protein
MRMDPWAEWFAGTWRRRALDLGAVVCMPICAWILWCGSMASAASKSLQESRAAVVALAPQAVPPEENAYPHWREARALLTDFKPVRLDASLEVDAFRSTIDEIDGWIGILPDVDRWFTYQVTKRIAEVIARERWLAECAPAMAPALRAGAMPSFRTGDDPTDPLGRDDGVRDIRPVIDFLIKRGRSAASRRDWEAFTASIELLLKLGEHLNQQRSLFTAVVGANARNGAGECISDWLVIGGTRPQLDYIMNLPHLTAEMGVHVMFMEEALGELLIDQAAAEGVLDRRLQSMEVPFFCNIAAATWANSKITWDEWWTTTRSRTDDPFDKMRRDQIGAILIYSKATHMTLLLFPPMGLALRVEGKVDFRWSVARHAAMIRTHILDKGSPPSAWEDVVPPEKIPMDIWGDRPLILERLPHGHLRIGSLGDDGTLDNDPRLRSDDILIDLRIP